MSGGASDRLEQTAPRMPIHASPLVDEDRLISFANDVCLRMTVNPTNLKGKLFLSLFPRDYEATLAKSLLESTLVDRKPRACEGLLRLEKRKVWGRIHFRSIRAGAPPHTSTYRRSDLRKEATAHNRDIKTSFEGPTTNWKSAVLERTAN